MPASRKSVDDRVDDRSQRGLVVLPSSGVVVPEAEKGWLASTKVEWAEFFGSDQAQALDGSTVPGVRRLFEMRDLQSRAWVRYKKEPYVDGSQGQPVANPAFDEAMKLERAIVALEDRYGVSLKALANLGVAVGQARLTAAELNRMAMESVHDGDSAIEAEGWEAV